MIGDGVLALIKSVLKNLGRVVTIDYPAGTWPGNKYSQIVPYGRGMHEFDGEKCTGCGACAAMCPNKSIRLIDDGGSRTVAIYLGRCMFCGLCQDVCPEEALRLTPKYELATKDQE
ncbi:MAG: 4Fe-4S binding protein, partial [Candidatus Bathyarchaeia archaeon]